MIPIGSPGYGGYFAGICKNNFLIISSKEYQKHLNWNDAISYCENLKIGCYFGWFLPTKNELEVIYHNRFKLERKIETFISGHYWSRTEVNDNIAWWYNLSNGISKYNYKNIKLKILAL